ncbi:MAG: SDR family oxidoreductase [Actinomycetota bacterium]|nr:SDR family oxidoreductase [Actinomycetota bacterium]
MIDINLTGVFKACRAVVPHIRAGGRDGSTVITSVIAGLEGVAGVQVGHRRRVAG